MRGWRVAFAGVAWLFLAGVVIQVFLAGVALFWSRDFTAHAGLGWLLGSAPLLLLALALPARFDRPTNGLIVGLTVVTFVQPELAAARAEAPLVAALHPVNALVVFWLAWLVARRSTAAVRRSTAAVRDSHGPTAESAPTP